MSSPNAPNTKYRPYLTVPQMRLAISLLSTKLNDKTKMLAPSERQDMLDMFYMFEDTIRKAERGTMKPAYIAKASAYLEQSKNVKITNMFSDEEIIKQESSQVSSSDPKILTDHEILANASPYEEDLIFLNAELDAGFIDQALYDTKLAALRVEHNIIEKE